MTLKRETCPSCSAPIEVPANASRMRCPYCMTSIAIERAEGDIALQIVERVNDKFESTSARTQAVIQDGTFVTQAELRRLQIAQDLSNTQIRLSNLQSEIRLLERMTQDRVARNQLKELQIQEQDLKQHRAILQQVLNPTLPSAGGDGATHTARRRNLGDSAGDWRWLLFSFQGRISRSRFWAGSIVGFVLWSIGIGMAQASSEAAFIGSLLFLVGMWILLAVMVKRMRDRNRSLWWLLLLLVWPIAVFWYLFDLGLASGGEFVDS